MYDHLARRIIAALEEIASVTESDFEGAPLIDLWAVVAEPKSAPALIGRSYGHPTIGEGRLTHTSSLLALSETGGWARTLNRFYRLGRPFEEAKDDLH